MKELLPKKLIAKANPISFKFVPIPGTDFEIQATPVTQLQWAIVTGYNPSFFIKNKERITVSGREVLVDPNRPVEQVSWNNIKGFLLMLNLSQKLYDYRLPTQAEWYEAAQAGSTGKYCFGDDETQLEDYAWFEKNSDSQTHPVAEKRSNALGLYDVHGNVWEWTNTPNYTQPIVRRTLMGGSWSRNAQYARSAVWNVGRVDPRYDDTGFRLIRRKRHVKI